MTDHAPPSLPADGFNEIARCRQGPMVHNRHDQYIGAALRKYGEYSRGETELFRQIVREGDTVIEAGANIGVHSLDLSLMVGPKGQVLAFEPQRLVFQTLCANLALNSRVNVRAFQAGVGRRRAKSASRSSIQIAPIILALYPCAATTKVKRFPSSPWTALALRRVI